MTKEWLITVRLIEDFPKGFSPRDEEDIDEIMKSCCCFITEQFLNIKAKYEIVEAPADDGR